MNVKKCGKSFKYNTQLRRHLRDPKKCQYPGRSDSPEF